MSKKGEAWNESQTHRDPWTLREVRQVTRAGCYNVTPTYHTGTAWTADGEHFVFASGRDGRSAVFCCRAATGEITQLTDWFAGMAAGGGRGFGLGTCMSPSGTWVLAVDGKSALRAVNRETLEERTLIAADEAWGLGSPTICADERHAVVVANFVPEPMRAGRPGAEDRAEHFRQPGGARFRVLRVPLAGGAAEVVYEEDGARCGHVQYNPKNDDLLLIDRDFPPNFWFGGDGNTNRIWALRISTGELTELPSPSGVKFQVHSTWTWDGRAVIYHCPSPDGYVIGLVDPAGKCIWEHQSEGWKHYGHVSAAPDRPAIILDGNLSDELLLWMYYDRPRPRVEVIARHGTTWAGHEGQFPHPHPQSDPTGRRIVFNYACRGRSDLFVVTV